MSVQGQSLTSVIMVSFYTGPTLFDGITSVLAQTEAVELIVINNGNPIDVVAKMKSIAAGDPRLRLIEGHGNVGFSKGCNMGARTAQGDCLLFLNPDSSMSHDAIARVRAYAANLKRPYMIGARLVGPDGKDQRGCRRALLTPTSAFVEALHLGVLFPHMRLNRHEEPVPSSIMPIPAISGAFMFVPTQDFWSIGGFDEDYFMHVDDLDLCLRFRRAGGEIYFVPDVKVTHFFGTSQVTRAIIEKYKARSFVRYFHKNFSDHYPKPFLWLLDAAIWLRAWIKIGLLSVA